MKIFLTSLWVFTILSVGLWSIHKLPFAPSFPYYTSDLGSHYSRELASFAHFDGIHYLRLMHHGYDDTGSQAFFPAYPALIHILTFGYFDPLWVAILLNALLCFLSLYLVIRSLPRTAGTKFIILFLTFPTSFFLFANYTESLFIFLVILFFHFNSQKRFFLAACIAGLASATRLVGIFLALSLLIDMWRNHISPKVMFGYSLVAISGLMGYLGYLAVQFHDPLMFIHVQTLFGAGRSGGQIILLPQVLYRYARILLTTSLHTLSYWRSVWELGTFCVLLLGTWIFRHKLTPAAMIFCLGALLLPTLSGTLSSFSRYGLVAIPLFIAAAETLSWRQIWLFSLCQYAMLIVAIALFVQGIFIA